MREHSIHPWKPRQPGRLTVERLEDRSLPGSCGLFELCLLGPAIAVFDLPVASASVGAALARHAAIDAPRPSAAASGIDTTLVGLVATGVVSGQSHAQPAGSTPVTDLGPVRAPRLFQLEVSPVPAAPAGVSRPIPVAYLYVSSTGSNQVLRFNAGTGAFDKEFVSTGLGGLNHPFGLEFGPDNNLYVSSRGTNNVLEYNGFTGDFMKVFASGNNLQRPTGLVFGADGNLYVSSSGNGRVLEFNGQTGAFIRMIGPGMGAPQGLTFGADHNLYVGTAVNNGTLGQVREYDGTTGAFLRVFTSGGNLKFATGITFGPDNNLYVSDLYGNHVLKYDGMTGTYQSVFAHNVARPQGVAFAPGGFFVSHSGTNQVVQYDASSGAFLKVFASGNGLATPTYFVFNGAAA
jgi:DNA-binding beta-propeller fold protein YncE